MQFERRATVVDSGIVETLDALLDDPVAICAIVTDGEGRALDVRFLRTGSGFSEVTGLPAPEGRTILEIMPNLGCDWIDRLGRVALDRTPMQFVAQMPAADRRVRVSAAPLGSPGCFVVSFRHLHERSPEDSERDAALDHAQHLLKEMGHRVMNSFAALSAVLAMEVRAAPPEGRDALKRVQGRIQALAALYRRLDGLPEVDRIEVAGYLAGNIQSFRDSLAEPAGLSVEADLAPLTLTTRVAVPLALILNELLTDAAAQALASGRPGTLRIGLRENGGQVRLWLEHDHDAPSAQGVGRLLIDAFLAELGGELTEEGPRATLIFQA